MADEGQTFRELCSYGSFLARGQEIRLADHAGFEQLSHGELQFIDETYPILRLGYPETVRRVQSIPVIHGNRLAWVLQIYNTVLEAESVEILLAYCRHLAVVLENALMKQAVHGNQSVLSVVTDFSQAIGAQLESAGLYRAILMKTAELAGAEQASLMIFDEASQELSIKCVKGLNEKIVQNLRVKPGQGIAGLVFETGRSLLVKNVDQDPRFTERQRARYKTKSLICVPLRIDQRKIGVINLTDKTGGGFDENDLKLVESVASHASVALDRTDYYKMSEDLRKISITDSLTDLYNRRFFQDRINEEIERSRRHGLPVSLIMLDIDNFKQYNDTYGHLAGDEALRLTAATIKNSVRNIDRVARYGGEEFAVILPMTEIAAARDIAERIRSGVAGRYFPDDALRATVKLTASLGIASFPQHADNLFDLVGNADKALYISKVNGKNRVAVFDKLRATANGGGRG
jgi:diguanylate cyclase (GGDEF)-like protein